MPGRRDPAWTNIPLAEQVCARRGSTRQERVDKEKKRKEEAEKNEKRRKEEQAMARILAQRWAEEDQRKQSGRKSPEFEEDRRSSRRRRERDDELPPERRRRRMNFEQGDPEKEDVGSGSEERDNAGEEGAQEGGGSWRSFAPPQSSLVEPIQMVNVQSSIRSNTDEVAPRPAKKKPEHGKKVAGIFGLSDSEDEKDSTRRELEAAARNKQARMSNKPGATAPRIATPGDSGSASASSGALPSSSDVQMRLAKFKMTCKGKWVDMPPDLKRDVERMMGKTPR